MPKQKEGFRLEPLLGFSPPSGWDVHGKDETNLIVEFPEETLKSRNVPLVVKRQPTA
jgi:hypothetical protein